MVKVLIYIEMLFIFSTPVLIRHLWQLKTVVFLHWCLICDVLLFSGQQPWPSFQRGFESCLTAGSWTCWPPRPNSVALKPMTKKCMDEWIHRWKNVPVKKCISEEMFWWKKIIRCQCYQMFILCHWRCAQSKAQASLIFGGPFRVEHLTVPQSKCCLLAFPPNIGIP